jgi:hypothetical protein
VQGKIAMAKITTGMSFEYGNLNAPTRLPNGRRFPHFLDIAIAQPQRNFFMPLQRLRKIIGRLN